MAYTLPRFEDVKKRYSRPLSESQREWVETKLGDAWERLKIQVPGVEKRIESDDLSADLVTSTLVEAVIRVLKNPGSIRSTGIDDGSVTIDTTVSSGRLYFLDDELELLRPQVYTSGMYSIPMNIPYWGP